MAKLRRKRWLSLADEARRRTHDAASRWLARRRTDHSNVITRKIAASKNPAATRTKLDGNSSMPAHNSA
jgi:hypothetical protein